jgi:hypothetical protein
MVTLLLFKAAELTVLLVVEDLVGLVNLVQLITVTVAEA